EHCRAEAPQRPRLWRDGRPPDPEPRLQPAGSVASAASGAARGGLPARPARAAWRGLQSALHARQYADPAIRLDARVERRFARLLLWLHRRPGIFVRRGARPVSRARLAIAALIVAAIAAFFAAGGPDYLSFDSLKMQQAALERWHVSHPFAVAAAFFGLYVAVTGLSVPGAAVLTLVAGALFGVLWGTVIVSFASSLGATIAFLSSRFLLRDWVQQRFGRQLERINEGI